MAARPPIRAHNASADSANLTVYVSQSGDNSSEYEYSEESMEKRRTLRRKSLKREEVNAECEKSHEPDSIHKTKKKSKRPPNASAGSNNFTKYASQFRGSPSDYTEESFKREEDFEFTKESSKRTYRDFESSKTEDGIFTKCLIFIGIVVVLASFAVFRTQKNEETKSCSFLKLKEQYPDEGDYLWNHLSIGVENILNLASEKPSVFLLIHNGRSKANDLIENIAQTASSCVGSIGSNAKVERIDFTSKGDYGIIIDKYKKTIKEGQVVLIANLNQISGEVAKALHAICDTYNPLVKKVIIFLSLTAEHKSNEGYKLIETAENVLRELWQSKVEAFELDPIIARVTDQVLLLQSK